MMGMGFLRLNKILKKHKWQRKNGAKSIDDKRTHEDRSFSLWLLIIAAIFILVLLIEVVRTSQLQ